MKTSAYIPFEGASETRRKHPKAVEIPLFARINQCYVDTSDNSITTPIPSYSFPAAPTIPATPARTRIGADLLGITAGGSGYTSDTTTDYATVVDATGTGAKIGFSVNGSGAIVSVYVVNAGVGYTNPYYLLTEVSATGTSGDIRISGWTISDYTAWFQLGAYVVLLGTTGHTRRIRWCAPSRPTVWDKWELDGDIEVLTGAGYVDLPGTGALESAVALGSLGVLFDAEGIGVLALTGDWEAPFSYAKTLNGVTAESDTRYIDGLAAFVGYDGRIWQTNGYSVTPQEGPLDLNTISEITWPPSSTAASFALNTATGHYVIHPAHGSGSGSNIWVDRNNGSYSTADGDDTTKYFTTGVLQLEPESERVHVQRVRVHWGVTGTFSGACTITVGCKGYYETTWHTSSATSLSTGGGNVESEIEVNYTAKMPHLKFTLVTQTGATVKVYGISVVADAGGRR